VDCFKRNLLSPFVNEQVMRYHRCIGQVSFRAGSRVWWCTGYAVVGNPIYIAS